MFISSKNEKIKEKMIIGFHYHSTGIFNNGYYTVGYIGIFIDSIAPNYEKVICFLHSPRDDFEENELDYKIKSKNVFFVNIGVHEKLNIRLLTGIKNLSEVKFWIKKISVLIVRVPTPFLFKFCKICKVPILIYIVGDYLTVSKFSSLNFTKKWLVRFYSYYYDYRLNQFVKNYDTIVNSAELYEKYKTLNQGIQQLKSTTISSSDFYFRKDTCKNNVIKILYTGRIDPSKGIYNILDACKILTKNGYNTEFHVAGIIMKGLENIPNDLEEKANSYGLKGKFKFHGRLKIGTELNAIYRKCDIYAIASKSEGFPRTIWEAMSNGLPVVTTDVGYIPHYLKNGLNAHIIKTDSLLDLVHGFEKLINNDEYRRDIIKNAYKVVKNNTLQTQSNRLKDIINKIDFKK